MEKYKLFREIQGQAWSSFISSVYFIVSLLFYLLGDYSSLTASFSFKRQISVTIIQLFFPAVAIVSVSWVSLWIHKNCVSARVGKSNDRMFIIMCSYIYIYIFAYTTVWRRNLTQFYVYTTRRSYSDYFGVDNITPSVNHT